MNVTHTLKLDRQTASDVAWAAQRAMDHLAAQTILAEHDAHHSAPANIAEYRSQIRRLRRVADKLEPDLLRPPMPETVAVPWYGGVYTILEGKPVRVGAAPDIRDLLEAGKALCENGLLTPQQALELLQAAVDRLSQDPPTGTARHPPSSGPPRERGVGRELSRDLNPWRPPCPRPRPSPLPSPCPPRPSLDSLDPLPSLPHP